MSAIPSSPDRSARHNCHCGKTFLRKEHLRRHEATHERPSFVCHICDRSFSRKDILRKHITVHDVANISVPKSRMACDGCHRSKSKCDGDGVRCSSCDKKGATCTFDRVAASTSKGSDKNLDEKRHLSSDAGVEGLVTSMPAQPSVVDSALFSAPMQIDALQRESPGGDRQMEYSSLQYILDCLVAAIAGKPGKLLPSAAPERVQSWQKKYISTYFATFHERWPVVHAPTLDDDCDDPILVGTVVMISAWNQDDENLKEMAMPVHERLMDYVQQKILPSEESGQDELWPFELYSTALLNVIFAFETGRAKPIIRARYLLALLLSALRERRVFNAEAIETQENTHHPGSFRPWNHQHRHKWKWLALCLVKMDTYMALFCNQPPMILVDELELGLTDTHALANAFGIDKFMARDPEDPIDRASCTMAAMARNADTILVSGTLFEDVWLGLCGTFARIWNCNQQRRIQCGAGDFQKHAVQRRVVMHQLEAWKLRLQGIADLVTEPARNVEAANRLLRIYRGEEDTNTPDWEDIVKDRIAAHLFNANLVYHLLGMHCTSDIKTMTAMTLGSWSMTGFPAANPDAMADERTGRWSITPEGRLAVLHAIHLLKIYASSFGVPQRQALDPIGLVALATAGIIMCCWIHSGRIVCHCNEVNLPNLLVDVVSADNGWVRYGGAIAVDGTPLCMCSSTIWMARFAGVLAQRGRGWGVIDVLVKRWQPSEY